MAMRGKLAVGALALVLAAVLLRVEGQLPDYPLSDQELKVNAGYYSPEGKYLGGIPKVQVGSPTYDKCTLFKTRGEISESESSTATSAIDKDADKLLCWYWNTNQKEELEDGDILDNCYCGSTASDNRYCDEWLCTRVQIANVKFCDLDTEAAVAPLDFDEAEPGDFEHRARRLQGCSTEIASDVTKCQCLLDDVDLNYCLTWGCDTYLNGKTSEQFECERPAENGLYCEAWTIETAKADGGSAVEACECVTTTAGANGICNIAECVERSSPNCRVCNLGLSIGLWAVLGMLGIVMVMHRCFNKDFLSPCVFFSIIWILGAGAGVALYGGQDGGMYGGIMWVVTIGAFLCCCRPPKET